MNSPVVSSPPPGLRIPFWDRSLPRRKVGQVGRAFRIIIRNPRYAAACAVVALAWHTGGLRGWTLVVAALAALTLWVWRRPEQARAGLIGLWRSHRMYRWTWHKTMRRCNAARNDVPVPLLLSVRSSMRHGGIARRLASWTIFGVQPFGWLDKAPVGEVLVDKLRVYIPTGLDPSAFQDYRGDLLKWGWEAQSCRVYNPQARGKTVELWNLVHDPLIEPQPPFPPPAEAWPADGFDLMHVEDGSVWKWRPLKGAAHMFVGGISGSGKGSVIGAILTALQTAVAARSCVNHGIDLQASELGMWAAQFSELAYTQEQAADLLEKMCDVMDKRTRKMFGFTRQHKPKPGDEAHCIVVDEGAMLLDKRDRKTYRRIVSALGRLTRGGRKASIFVVFLTQRAELDFAEVRKDFQIFIALEQNLPADVDMILGRGALAAGADASDIKMPGEAYVIDRKGILRGRFPYPDDEFIQSRPPAPGNEDPENRPKPPTPLDPFDWNFGASDEPESAAATKVSPDDQSEG